mgnify:FL=1
MHTLFLLNPTAGKTDCTQQLPQQINAAAARAGLAPEEYTIRITTHAGHARELARAAAAGAQQAGEPLRIFTAGGDGTFNRGPHRGLWLCRHRRGLPALWQRQ